MAPKRRRTTRALSPEQVASSLRLSINPLEPYEAVYGQVANHCWESVRSDSHGIVCAVAEQAGVALADWYKAAFKTLQGNAPAGVQLIAPRGC